MKPTNLFITVLFLMITINLNAQTGLEKPNIVPPSPESQALEKFIDQPVDYFRGTPNIEVPIWTIEQDGVTIPIMLKYHTGGIKVGEVASNEGLGWSLIAGGTISRNVVASPDDSNTGFGVASFFSRAPQCPDDWQSHSDGYTNAGGGDYDWEPDRFSYLFPSGSGKFVFNNKANDGSFQVVQTPKTTNKITYDYPTRTFTIVDENGIIYTFSTVEQSYRNTSFNSKSGSLGLYYYNSSWHLTKISYPWADTSRDIEFEYEQYTTVVRYPRTETKSMPSYHTGFNDAIIHHTQYRLINIKHANGSIKFNFGNFRCDLEGAQSLHEVLIKDSNSSIIKSFELEHQYFTPSGLIPESNCTASNDTPANTTRRLCLKSIQEKNSLGLINKPPYEFFYESDITLPDRVFSKAVDFWGFYNGKNGNNTLVPNYPVTWGSLVIESEGGDRHPNEEFCKAGSLVKIRYPTGGYTEYEYEMHRIDPLYAPQLSYPRNYFQHTATVNPCEIHDGGIFEVSDRSGGTNMKLHLVGQINNYSADCNQYYPPISINNNSTWLSIKVINTTTDEILYTSSGYTTVDGTNKNEIEYFYLPNGTYIVKFFRGQGNIEALDAQATIGSTPFTYTFSANQTGFENYKPVGGLRIKEIKNFESSTSNPIVKVFDYTSSGVESGRVNIIPNHSYKKLHHIWLPGNCPTNECELDTYEVDVISSSSPSDLFYDGVGYSKVTKLNKNFNGQIGLNGKTVYEYSYDGDLIYSNPSASYNKGNEVGTLCYNEAAANNVHSMYEKSFNFPFTPPISNAFKRGLLLREANFKYTNNEDHELISEILYTYKDDFYGINELNPDEDVQATQVVHYSNLHAITSQTLMDPNEMFVQHYYVPSRLVKLIQTEKIYYDNTTGTSLSNKIEYKYDNLSHLQQSRMIKTETNGDKKITYSLYPLDYSNTSGFIEEMKNKNIINKPVEKVIAHSDDEGNNIEILSALLTTYKSGNIVGLNDQVWKLENDLPIPLGEFKFSNQSLIGILPNEGIISEFSISNIDNEYPVSANLNYHYNDQRKLKQFEKFQDFSNSYIWGYNNSYPVAKILNAETDEIAYTSFEDGSLGGFYIADQDAPFINESRTGKQSINGTNNQIGRIDLLSGNYTISYWLKNGQAELQNSSGNIQQVEVISEYTGETVEGWTFYKKEVKATTVNNDCILNFSGLIDEVRLHPNVAQMTTYTYNPLIGMTSETDPNGNTIYYEYDDLGRLKLVKDKKQDIVKSFKYNYTID